MCYAEWKDAGFLQEDIDEQIKPVVDRLHVWGASTSELELEVTGK